LLWTCTFYGDFEKDANWNLRFDGKHINKTEYQVVVLRKGNREVKLAVLEPINGKGGTVFKEME